MAISGLRLVTLVAGMGLALAGCESTAQLFGGSDDDGGAGTAESDSVRLVDRDVEAPEVFQVEERGLWDGRPSLGGVWVAYPGVEDPERVIIRNEDNGNFVIGALFRRERNNPGPPFQVSSDAAEALEMLAGQPATLNVTALRREEAAENQQDETVATETQAPAQTDDDAPEPGAEDIAAAAGAAIDAAETGEDARPAPRPQTGAGDAPRRAYIQIGIFSVEDNARGAAETMRENGMVANVLREESRGQLFWRVTVGPATSQEERDALLASVRDLGFSDAYAVPR
ncbi:SPOR domain-containing protein [Rhodobacteraceae bacterium WD3A24]|nr:SPOR domain-containing protein [Rhodobacteraceae bacterium WD3A24]